MAVDRLWLSPAYGDDCVAIHFSWQRVLEAVEAMTAEIETMPLPFGGRPHWGKIMHARSEQLAPLCPKLPEFRELAQSYDPGREFRNKLYGFARVRVRRHWRYPAPGNPCSRMC